MWIFSVTEHAARIVRIVLDMKSPVIINCQCHNNADSRVIRPRVDVVDRDLSVFVNDGGRVLLQTRSNSQLLQFKYILHIFSEN